MLDPTHALTFLLGIAAGTSAASATPPCLLFSDPLDGSGPASAWRTAPETFVDLAEGGRVLRYERGTTWESTTQPWIGDWTWSSYRVEIDVRPEKMWAGIDVHVRDDGRAGTEITLFEGPDGALTVEASGLWGLASAWKLWPIGQRTIPHAPGAWVHLRLDVAQDVVNVYAGDDPQAYASFRDLPFSSGGVRLASYAGSALFRSLQVSRIPEAAVLPLLGDGWRAGRQEGVVRSWTISLPQPPGVAPAGLPPTLASDARSWQPAPVDGRGVVNLTALFAADAGPAAGVAFARTQVSGARREQRRAWVTYTDRLSVWCNGTRVFEGPPREWFHPDREKNGNSRLIPDQYEIQLPLEAGVNEIVVRTEMTEPTFGWGFWMRLEEPQHP